MITEMNFCLSNLRLIYIEDTFLGLSEAGVSLVQIDYILLNAQISQCM